MKKILRPQISFFSEQYLRLARKPDIQNKPSKKLFWQFKYANLSLADMKRYNNIKFHYFKLERNRIKSYLYIKSYIYKMHFSTRIHKYAYALQLYPRIGDKLGCLEEWEDYNQKHGDMFIICTDFPLEGKKLGIWGPAAGTFKPSLIEDFNFANKKFGGCKNTWSSKYPKR